MPDFASHWWLAYLVLPVLIFLARIADVSLDTMRIIFLNRGRKFLAPALGFFEVLIWVVAITQVIKNLSNPVCYLAYGAGFATGNFVGMLIEEKVAAGLLALRIITRRDAGTLVAALRAAGYGATVLNGHGADGPVNVVFVVIRRKHFPTIIEQIRQHTTGAFYSAEEVRSLSGGVIAAPGPAWRTPAFLRWGGPR
jgi:uncharacterized protein YebE (UPF0316 family)